MRSGTACRWSRALVAFAVKRTLIGRLGQNPAHQPFWPAVAFLAIPGLFVLPSIIDLNGSARDSYGLVVIQTTVTLAVVLLQFGLMRVTLFRNRWRGPDGAPESQQLAGSGPCTRRW